MIKNSEPSTQDRWLRAVQLAGMLSHSAADHVPVEEMLDYAYGGLDDELLNALYGPHLKTCGRCSDARDLYRGQRPLDPARMAEVPEFSSQNVETEQYPLDPLEAGRKLVDFVADGEGTLVIVAGEANPAVYGPELAAALRKRAKMARKAGDRVPRIICGPAMGLDDEHIPRPEDAVLPPLAESGDIELFISSHRQRLHFRVSGEAVYTEEYHRAGDGGTRRGFWYRSRPIANLFYRRFEAILRAGLAVPATAESFVYLHMDRVRAIEKAVPNFDLMLAPELAAAA